MGDSVDESGGSRGGDSMTEEVSAKCNDWVLEAMLRRQALLFGSR